MTAATSRPDVNAADVARRFVHPRVVAADDFLVREISRRLLDRLAAVRVDAQRVLDLGSGDGADAAALAGRFPDAEIHHVDIAAPSLRRHVDRAPSQRGGLLARLRRRRGPLVVQADFEHLPYPKGTFDVLWSNAALHWHLAPHRILPEWSRVLRTGGLVAFSAFGPDSLREVADVLRALDDEPHVLPFTDMHDYGDQLVGAGLTTPVVDVERLTLTYSTPASLWADVRALGGLPWPPARKGLRGRSVARRIADALERQRDAAGRLSLTIEVVFGHAWKAEPRTTAAGEAIVRVTPRRDRT
jgi:malonyl-CoA O-methyltransferase